MATLLASLAAAPLAWGDGSWYEIGSSDSPVNHVSTADASNPILAAGDGTPFLSWNEADTVNGSLVGQARAAMLGSSPLEARPWDELLAATGQPAPNDQRFSINLDPGQNATQTHVVVIGTTPYAAWIEPDSNGHKQVRVETWDGTDWQLLGGVASLNVNASDNASDVSIAEVGGDLFVAWTETVSGVSQLYGKEWNGTSWSQLGGVISTSGAQAREIQASDATYDPTVVWVEVPQGSSNGIVQMSSFYSSSGNPATWNNEPQPISASSTDAHSPSVANVYGHLDLAFSQHTTTTDQVFVKELDGSTWTTLGGQALNVNPNAHAIEPTLTSTTDGSLWAAWAEQSPSGGAYQLRTASYDYNTSGPWNETLPPVNHDDQQSASDPTLIDAAVQGSSGPSGPSGPTGPSEAPVVAWTEPDSAGHQQVRSAAFGTPPTNTALPSISGTPENGDQLTCSNGAWSAGTNGSDQPTHYTDIWERGARSATSASDPSWTPISGATGSTYTVQAADDGFRVHCRVVATYGVVSSQAVSTSLETDAGPPSLDDISYPRIIGTPIVYHTLTCDIGPSVDDPSQPGWHNNPDFTYFWLKNGVPIEDATSSTYTPIEYRYSGGILLPDGDGDHNISCGVHASNDLGSTTADSASVYEVDGEPFINEAPTITVVPDNPSDPSPLAESLTCSTGTFLEGTGNYTYQWLRSETPITGATSSTYRVTVQDLGREISCESFDTNIAGISQPNESAQTLVPIPASTSPSDTVSIHEEGATNQVDPTSLLPVTSRYANAINAYTVSKLQAGIAAATATCKTEQALHDWPGFHQAPKVHDPLQTEEDRCRVLLGDSSQVVPEPDGGVRWLDGDCNSPSAVAEGLTYTSCPDLDIQITPIDPQKPPALSGDEIAAVGPSSPAEILWDLNDDGKTDAICPGSAPVLSTIFNYDSHYDPRVTIIDQDGTVSSGDIKLSLGTGQSYGELRSSQVRVCETSLDPPPTPQLPCVTSGQIGSLTISNANLCPIDARQIDPTDFGTLLPSDLQAYLLAASEGQLAADGTLTDRVARSRPDGGPLRTSYVSWSKATEPSVQVAIRPARGLHASDATQAIATGSVSSRTVAADTASMLASLTSENSPAKYPALALSSAAKTISFTNSVKLVKFATFPRFKYDPSKAVLAYDQIYVARGPGGTSTSDSVESDLNQAADAADSIVPGVTGDAGEAMLNGVGLSAAPIDGQASGMLLIGSDVAGALPGVKSFTLTGRNIAATMGLPTDCTSASTCKAVALGEAHAYTTQLKDDVTAEAKADATQELQGAASNLDQMTQDYKNDAKAYGQQLLDRVKDSLDVGPFNFGGDANVSVNADGTATLTVTASLPGLTGTGIKRDAQGKPVLDTNGNPAPVNGSPISGSATFNADQQGHLALRGVTIKADDAFFLGIELTGVNLTYNSNTGFDVMGKIVIGALGNTVIDIKNFQLDKDGHFQDLNVDFKAGAGFGVPIFPGISLNELGFDLNTAQSNFSATVGVAIGANLGAGCAPLGAVGTVDISLDKPVEVKGDVSPQIFCLPFGDLEFDVKGDGSVSLTGQWGLHTGIVDFDIDLGAMFGLDKNNDPVFQIYAHGDGSIIGILDGYLDAVLSSRGVAACGSIDLTIPIVGDVLSVFTGSRTIHIAAGAAEDFKNGVPLTPSQIYSGLHVFTGCDIGSYYPLGKPTDNPSIRTASGTGASTDQTFRLPADRGPTLIKFTGAGSAPRLTLVSPSGQTYNVTQTGKYGTRLAHGAWGSIIDPASETAVILPNPTGGVWTVQLAAGSAQIINVSAAPILPPPAIKARVSGSGPSRVLHYAAVREPGQTIQITEQSKGEDQTLGTIGASAHEKLVRGTIHYTLGEAESSTRRIVAEAFENGVPRKLLVLATYHAANPAVGAVQKLRVRRSGKHALISWHPGTLDSTYLVRVTYGDGRVILGVTSRPHFSTQRITHNEGVHVTIYAQSGDGRTSRPATATLTGSMLIGSVTPLGPYKAPKTKPTKPTKLKTKSTKTKSKKKHT